MSAEFCETMQASAVEHEAQLRSLHQERREAEEDAARRHAAAVQSMQQAHKLEQVPLVPPVSISWGYSSRPKHVKGRLSLPVSSGI